MSDNTKTFIFLIWLMVLVNGFASWSKLDHLKSEAATAKVQAEESHRMMREVARQLIELREAMAKEPGQ